MATKLLIYDGECAYCRGFARLVGLLDSRKSLALLPFESEGAQRVLRAQFGDSFGFSMFLFEEDCVSWGREAARRIVQGLQVPGARVAFWLYPALVAIVSWLTRRQRKVCGPECVRNQQQASQVVPLQAPVKLELQRLLLSL